MNSNATDLIVEIRLEDPENISHPVSGLGNSFLAAVESLRTDATKQKATLPRDWRKEAYTVYCKLLTQAPNCCEMEAEFVDSDMTMEVCKVIVKIRYRYLALPTAKTQPQIVSSNRYAALEPQEVYSE